MQLFLVRHGETESNRKGLALGRADVPLNARGRWQAERLAIALADEPLAAVYSSPLQRARCTAEPIAAAHGLQVQVEEGLIEMDIGELDGLTFPEIRKHHPGLLEKWVSPEGQATAIFGSESLADVQRRAWDAVDRIASRHADRAACAVTHNFVILSILAKAMGIGLADFRRLRHGVAAIALLDVSARRVRIERLNDVCHLGDES